MKKLVIILILIYSAFSYAESGLSVNMRLHKKLQNRTIENYDIYLLVKGNVSEIRNFTEMNHGNFIVAAGDIASVKLSLSAVAELITKPFVKQVGYDQYSYKTMNDTMRMLTHVDEVHAGQAPLARAYKGRNIIMGIIDSGLDTDHPDFKDSTGHTRVKWLWDMNLPNAPNTPQPYGYGQEWSGAQIDSGLSAAHTGQDQYGHGTYVAGIAAGNGSAVGRFTGVAPETDLIIVGFNFAAIDTVSRMAHAVNYIFTKAQQLGKPCVINASLGDYYGSHDGQDLQSQFIDNLLNQQSGRVLVQACGDIGTNYPFHVQCNSVAGDTVFAWIKGDVNHIAYMQFYSDTASFNQIHFAIGADKVTPYYEFRGRTNFFDISSTFNNLVSQDLYNGMNRLGNIQMYTSLADSVYLHEVYITLDSADYYWRFITTGNGKYDSWHFDYNLSPVPSVGVFPDIAKYVAPDTMQTIVSGINCLNSVISVANYTNTDRHYDVDTVLQVTPTDYPRQIAVNSGRGPTRTGMIKPEIAAPGNHIISSGVLSLIPGLLGGQRYKVAPGAHHITGGGTSASSPAVAGMAALYLEQNTGADWQDVKTAFTNCAFNDSLMWGPYPNNAWGYGKINVYEAMTTCSLVNSAHPPSASLAGFSIFPNPAKSEIHIESNFTSGVYILSDLNGRKLAEAVFNSGNFTVKTNNLPEGVYLLSIKTEKYLPAVNRFIISR